MEKYNDFDYALEQIKSYYRGTENPIEYLENIIETFTTFRDELLKSKSGANDIIYQFEILKEQVKTNYKIFGLPNYSIVDVNKYRLKTKIEEVHLSLKRIDEILLFATKKRNKLLKKTKSINQETKQVETLPISVNENKIILMKFFHENNNKFKYIETDVDLLISAIYEIMNDGTIPNPTPNKILTIGKANKFLMKFFDINWTWDYLYRRYYTCLKQKIFIDYKEKIELSTLIKELKQIISNNEKDKVQNA